MSLISAQYIFVWGGESPLASSLHWVCDIPQSSVVPLFPDPWVFSCPCSYGLESRLEAPYLCTVVGTVG